MNTTGVSKCLRRVSVWAGAVCLATLVAACGGGGAGGTEPPPTPSGTATIGSEGGSLSSAEGVRLTVPAGAMTEPVTLRVARDTTGLHAALASGTPDPDKAVALSPTYAMTPHGTTFAQPVELRIPIDRAAAAGPGLLVALRTDPGKLGWDVLPILAVENGDAVVAITSFSFYRVVKIVTLPQQTPNSLPVPPQLEMSMTLGGAAPTSFNLTNSSGTWTSTTTYRRLYGTIANRTESLRLSGRLVGLPASCANIALAGNASTTQNPTAADTNGGGYVGFNGIAEPVFAEVTATQGVDTTGGVQRTMLDFAFDINIDNAPYKAQLYENLRSRNLTSATPPVGLTFNAFARCTTPIDLGGGVVLQNWKITPGLEQLPWDPTFPDSLLFDDKRWVWNTILFTTDYLPQGFITHPQPVTVAAGTAASFSTSAWPVPVGEQRIEWWRSDNDGASWSRVRTTIVPVSATADTYTIAATALTDHNALLRVRLCAVPRTATLAEACTDGIAARLSVLQGVAAASFTQQPRAVLVRSGQTASFSVAVDGSPAPTLRWQARPANSSGAWADVSTGSGATTANYTTAALALSDNGLQLRAVANNVVGDVGSVPVTVSVSDVDVAPNITSQPAALSVVAGSEAVFAIVARGTEALSYQWRRNGVAITGANAPVLKLAAVSEADATGYSVQVSNTAGSATSDAALLSVSAGAAPAVAPTIVTQPVSVLVNSGNTATFAVGVSGSGPLSYQWLRNGVPITGATAAFYSLAAAAVGDAATYAVQVSNSAGNETSWNVVLTVNTSEAPTAVVLMSQPSPQIQAPGGSATFAVAVTGSGPITYQWLKNGAPISGATSGVLTLTGIVAEDAASYSVTVGNGLGSVTSNAASLTVLGVPVIGSQPAPATVVAGGTASFSVSATGEWLRYQWLRNSVAIAGATAASYTTPVLTEADSGAAYSVLVYNGAAVVFSQAATLTVTAAPAGGLALVANSNANTLSIFRANASTGALSSLGTAGTGAYPYAIAITPNGQFAYVSNLVGNNLSSYSINAIAGTVTMVGSSVNSVNPYGIAMDPLGRFVWAVNYSASTVSAYTINGSTGQLTAAGAPVATGTLPYAVAAHPSGNYVYVANEMGNSVSAYSVNASTGQLTLLAGTIANSAFRPHSIAVDPTGRFVYVTESGGSGVAAFSINAGTGVLTVIGYVNSGGSSPSAVVVHPNGQFAYVANQGASTVAVFSVNSVTGALTAVGAPIATGSSPTALSLNAAGSHLYVTNQGANSASAFAVNASTGALTSLGASVATGGGPQGIAVTP